MTRGWNGRGGEPPAGGTCSARRDKVCLGGGRLLHLPGRMGRDFVPSIRGGSCGALPVKNYSGGGGEECGRRARGSRRKVLSWGRGLCGELCRGSYRTESALPGGPEPGFQPSLPKPCKLENLGPSLGPGRRGREAGREGAEFGNLCDLDLAAAGFGPPCSHPHLRPTEREMDRPGCPGGPCVLTSLSLHSLSHLQPQFRLRGRVGGWEGSPQPVASHPPLSLPFLSEKGQERSLSSSPSAQRESKGSVLRSSHLPKWRGL